MILRNILNRISKGWQLAYYFYSDYRFYKKHYLGANILDEDHLSAHIMLVMHQLEKGMSFTNHQREFGGEKAKCLVLMVRKCISTYGVNEVCKIAINVLHEYMKRDNATHNADIQKMINSLCEDYRRLISDGYAGVKLISEPPVFNKTLIKEFFNSRSSVREYSDFPVTEREFKEALSFASCTPSACNRQASRVHFFCTKNMIKKLIENQLGNQGWCDNASACFVVTVNESYFGGGYERHEAFIDGGLYAMNFVYGLHLNHVATCFKMFVREPKREKDFKKLANIPENEIPIILILAGHYKDAEVVSPKSVRINFEE